MDRRDFIALGSVLGASTVLNAGILKDDVKGQKRPSGAVTLYYEFKIAGPQIKKIIKNISKYAKQLDMKKGFLSLSLKHMVGDSTMSKNLPVNLKGVLKSAFVDGAMEGSRPFIYSLYIRFNNFDNLIASKTDVWFEDVIQKQLFAYKKMPNGKIVKLPLKLDYYQGIYQTVAAGDTNGVYRTQDEILKFLSNQKDETTMKYKQIPQNGSANGASISVMNHVTFHSKYTKMINEKATNLLSIAQHTYQPSKNKSNGISGTLDDSNYRKAVTTEIMQNAFTSGDSRNYLFHGVWECVADHENSHIDNRFRKAAGPVGAFVIAGPVEPFYQTTIVHNKK